MSAKLTPWFPASVKPEHIGTYPTKCDIWGCNHEHYWNGKKWFASYSEQVEVVPLPWRGLAVKP